MALGLARIEERARVPGIGPLREERQTQTSAPFGQTELVYDESDMNVASPVYLEIIDLIAAGATTEAVADFRPSPEVQKRVAALIEREGAGSLSAEEKAELDDYRELARGMLE